MEVCEIILMTFIILQEIQYSLIWIRNKPKIFQDILKFVTCYEAIICKLKYNCYKFK